MKAEHKRLLRELGDEGVEWRPEDYYACRRHSGKRFKGCVSARASSRSYNNYNYDIRMEELNSKPADSDLLCLDNDCLEYGY